MTIECVGPGFTYRWPGGEVRLEPGKPIDLPDERAKRLLQKAPGRLRVVHPIVPGATITWLRHDGSTHTALIEYVHVDAGGTWLFVSIEQSWAALNVKYLQWAQL